MQVVGPPPGHYVAEFFIDRAWRIADSLQIGLNIGPKALHLPSRDADGTCG